MTEINSLGTVVGTFNTGSGRAYNVAADPAGNIWIGDYYRSGLDKMNPLGNTVATYSNGSNPAGLAIDASGNVWTASLTAATVTRFPGLALGPQFFPYSGPQFP